MKKDKIIRITITFLLLLLPILDCLRTTSFKNIEIFGIALIEIINIILISVALICTFFKINKRKLIKFILYTLSLLMYILLHNMNILKFDPGIFPQNKINIFVEIFYIFRVYYLPMIVLYILYENKDIFNMQYYKKIIKIIITMISLSIIILNIFKLSYASYGVNNSFVNYNIFDFYKSKLSFDLLSTRGLFDSTNEISVILFTLLPINLYLLFKENRKSNYILLFLQIMSMIILGTRISTYGSLLICFSAVVFNIFMYFIKKNKILIPLIVIFILSLGYYFISPIGVYNRVHEKYKFVVENKECYEELKNTSDENVIINNINKNNYEYKIFDCFLKIYPVENDPYFWQKIALRDKSINNDNRNMKIQIISRIKEKNNNFKNDSLYGMGYTLNFMDLERDYVYQYYIFGIVGIIVLIFPYIIYYFALCIKTLFNLKRFFNESTLMLIMAPFLTLVSAYLSGHVFGWVSPMMYLVMVLNILRVYLYEEGKNNGKGKHNCSSI